jgi:hypothetical protein
MKYDCAYYICDVFLVLEIIKSAAQKKYSSSELVDKLKGALATVLTKKIMFWKLVNSFTMMK